MKKRQSKQTKLPFYRRKWLRWTIGGIITIILLVALAFRISPWPGALVIRHVFDKNAAKTKAALEKYTPSGVTQIANRQYIASDKDAFLDVYYPSSAAEGARLPTVVWTHGGAWLSGDKTNAEPYFRLIASKGYTVVSLNYTRAPSRSYPAQIQQLNQAHGFIVANAGQFKVDTNNIFLAGDSAGSQLSAEMAAMVTNPAYANEVGVVPALSPSQLKGVILTCGIYKMEGLVHPDPTLPKIVGWGDDVAVWAYAGTRDFTSPIIRQMSPYYYLTKDFPPAFITGGNADPLTDAQSKPLAEALQSLGVPVTPLFYPADHQPALPHEYQFNLDTADGQNAFAAIAAFVNQYKNSN